MRTTTVTLPDALVAATRSMAGAGAALLPTTRRRETQNAGLDTVPDQRTEHDPVGASSIRQADLVGRSAAAADTCGLKCRGSLWARALRLGRMRH
jgi:hypothetical protein